MLVLKDCPASKCGCASSGTCEGYGDPTLGAFKETRCVGPDGKDAGFSCSTAEHPKKDSKFSTSIIARPWPTKGDEDWVQVKDGPQKGKWYINNCPFKDCADFTYGKVVEMAVELPRTTYDAVGARLSSLMLGGSAVVAGALYVRARGKKRVAETTPLKTGGPHAV